MKHQDGLLPDKPSEKHTVLITCQKKGCGKKRWIKPQDKFQVKLCRWCKDEENRAKSKIVLQKLKQRVAVREKVYQEIDWRALRIAAHEAGMKAVAKYRASPQWKKDMTAMALDQMARVDQAPAKRLWPK